MRTNNTTNNTVALALAEAKKHYAEADKSNIKLSSRARVEGARILGKAFPVEYNEQDQDEWDTALIEYNDFCNNGGYDDNTPDDDKSSESASHSVSDEVISVTLKEIQQRVKEGSNCDKLLAPEITLDELQKRLQHRLDAGEGIKSLTGFEQLILKIRSVEKHDDGMKINLDTGRAIKVYYNGMMQKYNTLGRKSGKLEHKWDGDRLRVTVDVVKEKAKNTSLLVERVMMLAFSVYNNKIPANISDLSANVKDLSGNKATANKYGLTMNFHPSNLEWCLGDDNSAHCTTVKNLKDLTGHIYRVSALDNVLKQLTRLKNPTEADIEIINYYIKLTGIEIVR